MSGRGRGVVFYAAVLSLLARIGCHKLFMVVIGSSRGQMLALLISGSGGDSGLPPQGGKDDDDDDPPLVLIVGSTDGNHYRF